MSKAWTKNYTYQNVKSLHGNGSVLNEFTLLLRWVNSNDIVGLSLQLEYLINVTLSFQSNLTWKIKRTQVMLSIS